MLSMKQKLQLMQWVVSFNEGEEAATSTQELVDAAAKALSTPVTAADLKEACKNAEIKWSSLCNTGTSPVALLHIKVAKLIKDNEELRAHLAEMKHSLIDMKHQMRTMDEKLSPLRVG